MRVGMKVLLSGHLYTARDGAHRRLVAALQAGGELPFDICGETIYYAGPSPAPPGRIIGAIGPTTAARMDELTPPLLAAGLRVTMGKGPRSGHIRELLREHHSLYLVSYGGAGALLSQYVKGASVVGYEDLGPEAIMRLEIEHFPAIVANDIYGDDLFEKGQSLYRR